MVKAPIVILIAIATAGLGVVLGRMTLHAESSQRSQDPSQNAGRETSATTPATPRQPPSPHPMTRSAFTEAMKAADRDAPQAEATLPGCVQQLRVVRELVNDNETMRAEKEGTPIPARAAPAAPRFASTSMTGALQAAFTSTSIPGSVEGVDCSEFPCIVFGRIRGAEDQMAKLEHSKSMAVYEEDILTVLLWRATDEEAKDAAESRHESDEGLEQSLYAVSLYPRADKQQFGDNIDRRIRSELWNGMSPADETGSHPVPEVQRR